MLLLVYAVALLVAVLVSEWSHRTVLSSAVVFLVCGAAAGPLGLDLLTVQLDSVLLREISELALFSILFSDGLKVGWTEVRRAWRLPGRALLVGMPLTATAIAVTAHLLFTLPWASAFLVGVILSPTDPVFASAIVGREEIPWRLRHLLNVESGVNDGLALPFVLLLLALPQHRDQPLVPLIGEVAGGLGLGIAIAAAVAFTRRLRVVAVATSHAPLLPFAVALLILASARALNVNIFLAAFAGGMSLATWDPAAQEEFHDVGERLSETLKLAAVLLVSITVSPLLPSVTWTIVLFALIVLTLARVGPLLLALAGSHLSWPERLVAAWFGPKGFASVIYGLMLLQSGIDGAERLYVMIALTIVLSIVLHSSTDVPIAHAFERRASRSGRDSA